MKLFKYLIIGSIGILLGGGALVVNAQLRYFTSGQLAPNASNLKCLTTDGTFNAWSTCGTGGGGSGGGTWSTTTSSVSGQFTNYPNNTTDIPCIGGTATTTCKFFFDPNTNRFIIVSGNLGVGTTTPGTALSINGNGVVTGDLVVRSLNATSTTATSTFSGGLQTTTLNVTSTTATSTHGNGINLTGGCFAINGTCTGLGSGSVTAVSVATANGFAGSSSGGATPALTLSTTISGLLKGNGTAISAAIPGSDYANFAYPFPAGATTTVLTFSNGLTGNVTGNVTGTAGSLAANGANCSAGNYPLGVDASGAVETCTAVPTLSSITGTLNLASQVTGTLPVANGGTGNTTFTGANLLYGNGTGSIGSIATTTASCSGLGMLSCSSFTIVGSSPVTLQSAPYLFPNNATSTQLTFSGGFVGTNGSTTNFVATSTLGVATSTPGTPLSVTGNGTFTGQVEALNFYATSTTATSTFLGQISANRVSSASERWSDLVSCDTIDTDQYGNARCGSDATGAGGAVTGNGITGMMTAWSSGSNIVGTSTIIGERFVATSTTAASSTIPHLEVSQFDMTNGTIGDLQFQFNNMILGVDSSGLMEGTSTPTAGSFNATSTTASSTLQGLTVNALDVRSTTATSTFANGINLNTGCLAIRGTCITGGGSASSASTTLLSDSNTFTGTSNVFTQKFGIATSSPGTALGVTGAGVFTDQVTATNFFATSTTATSTIYGGFKIGTISGRGIDVTSSGNIRIVAGTSNVDGFNTLIQGSNGNAGGNLGGPVTINGGQGTSGSAYGHIVLQETRNGGNVGIGTTSPYRKLSVAGDGVFDDNVLSSFFTATSTATSTFNGGIQTNLLRVTSTTASSTFSNGINLTSGCFAFNGQCISGGGAGGTGTVTTLTAGTNITFSSGATCTTTCTINSSGGSASSTLLSTDSNTFSGSTTTFPLGVQHNGYNNFAATTTFTNNTIHTVENKLAGTSTTQVIDWAKGNFQTVGISTSAITMVFQNPTNGDGVSLLVCNASSGTAGTITWPNNVSWPGGVQPGQTTTANQCDLWSWRYSVGTSTPTVGSAKYFLTGLIPAYQ